ncbi:MAG: DUF86 domain-containing protein [Chloroflexi bacterium]|nr:DUF86 domain-containing protein [Chloroflexota bacterium]
MSSRDWQIRILDMLASAENILSFTTGMDYNSFLNDPKTIRAVAFELITIGEAVHSIPQKVQVKYAEIPWEKIQGIRNILVHEYFRMDEEILWKTIQDSIPKLIDSMRKIIAHD